MDNEREFTKRLDQMDHELRDANAKLELLFHIQKRKVDRLKEMNIAPAFFQTVINSLVTDAIISFAGLYDTDQNSCSLGAFLGFVETHLDLFCETAFIKRNEKARLTWDPARAIDCETLVKQRRELRAMETILKRLKLQRNKRFAHKDRRLLDAQQKLTKLPPVTFGDLRTLAGTAFRILNAHSLAFNAVHLTIRPMNLFDIDKLLDTVHVCRTEHTSVRGAGST